MGKEVRTQCNACTVPYSYLKTTLSLHLMVEYCPDNRDGRTLVATRSQRGRIAAVGGLRWLTGMDSI